MQYTILLNKNEKTKEVEAQEQARFVKSVLESLEVPVEFNPEEPLSIESKINFIKSLNVYNINIINSSDGELKVYLNKDLVGWWKKCTYKLKQDYTQIDRNKRLFIEMSIDFWTVFDDE